MNIEKIEYCNWSFEECLKRSQKWLVKRDCEDEPIVLSRGSSKNWKAYEVSLLPQVQQRYKYINAGSECPSCRRGVNGINPYDDGETWRK